jgi:HPt (histidine-containing phosphotransfer) domain-containing protein
MREAARNGSQERLAHIAYLAHQLKGSGGSYGFQSITENAADLEKYAEAPNGNSTDIERFIGSLSAEIDRAARELQDGAAAR